MILRIINECDGMIHEFYEIVGFLKHLKDYVGYISKDVKII